MAKLNNILDVSQYQLCSGCGICAAVEPDRFFIKDVLEYGRRPFLKKEAPKETGDAFKVCPGAMLKHTYNHQDPKLVNDLVDAWGPVYEVLEGYAVDEEIRFSGSSGGVVTALSLYCLEQGGIEGVIHTAARKDKPYLNKTVVSRSRKDLLATTGSRYSPASPCEKLNEIENGQEGVNAFIGKPCDVAAVHQAIKIRPKLEQKIGLTIAFFCAGSPSTDGLLKLMAREGIDNPDAVSNLRFRGKGWPGRWTVKYKNYGVKEGVRQLSYAKSWGFLQQYRQWRCYICPDHTGEFADISVGDPWYREVKPNESGRSLIVVRTQRGQEFIRGAIDAGYIGIEKSEPSLLPKSQPNLLDTRGSLWARLIILRVFGAAVPKYYGFKMFDFWWSRLSWKDKIRSIFGTMKRVYRKGLYKRV